MTSTLRPWAAIDEFQHLASDYLYEHNEALALLDTGAGKTMIAMTAGQELIDQGVINRAIVFAPLRVAQVTWPQERKEWEHLRHARMVEWGGEPALWAPSLWRDSRLLWGQRTSLAARLPGTPARVRKAMLKAAQKLDPAMTDDRLPPSLVQTRINEEKRAAEARLGELIAEERKVNKELRRKPPVADRTWYVTSFENLEWFTELFEPGASPFDLWVVDETGKVAREPRSPRYKALAKHMPKAKIRWGLNATPAPEGAEDLFGQVQIVSGPRIWGKSFYQWRQRFFTPTDYFGYSYRLQLGAFEPLMADLNQVSFRVPTEMLSYQKTITHRQIVRELPPKARTAYADMERTLAAEIEDAEDPVIAMSEGAASVKLRQITQGYLYEVDTQGRRTVHILHEEKLHAVADLIDSMGREPLLIAYAFDQDLENLRKVWKNIPYLGQGVSSTTVADHIAKWNKRELPVLALHPNCLHPDTLVLTEYRGWVRIIDVHARERVFDGTEFVTHKGCQLSGIRPVIERLGLTMTPEHLVLVNDEWVRAEDVRDTGDAKRAARYTYAGDDPRLRALLSLRSGIETAASERAEKQPRRSAALPVVPARNLPQNDGHPTVAHMERHAGPRLLAFQPKLQKLWRARDYGRSRVAELQKLLARYAARLRGRSDDRAGRRERPLLQGKLHLGYQHGAAGQQAHHPDGRVPGPADAPIGILSCRGRDERRDNAVPRPEQDRGRRDGGVSEIVVPARAYQPGGLQNAQEVYDLVDCGPRQRFAVRNDAGEVFIVHNSASHGLNLQYGGHHICWLALPWGLDPYKQTNERIDRRGQAKPCFGHHIVMADSKDQDVSDVLVEKNAAQNMIIEAIRAVGRQAA